MTSRKPAHLLLVDDDPGLLKLLGMRLVSEGYSVVTAESGQEGLKVLSREKIDLVISDLRMDEMDGLQLFTEIQKQQPGMPVIILTAHGSIPDAVAATQQGVFSFLTKPVDKDALYKAIDSALEHAAPSGDDGWRESIVTRSPVMLRLLEQARMVAQSDVSVLINGQSGTGKEILAQAIHNASPRSKNAFIAINCGALPEQLLESELFGHARGAFTGAVSSREGLFQAAEGGTLFLDESWRYARAVAGQTAARVAGAESASAWQQPRYRYQRAHYFRYPSRFAQGDGAQRVPRRSLLSTECRQPENPGAGRACGRYPAAGKSPFAPGR